MTMRDHRSLVLSWSRRDDYVRLKESIPIMSDLDDYKRLNKGSKPIIASFGWLRETEGVQNPIMFRSGWLWDTEGVQSYHVQVWMTLRYWRSPVLSCQVWMTVRYWISPVLSCSGLNDFEILKESSPVMFRSGWLWKTEGVQSYHVQDTQLSAQGTRFFTEEKSYVVCQH